MTIKQAQKKYEKAKAKSAVLAKEVAKMEKEFNKLDLKRTKLQEKAEAADDAVTNAQAELEDLEDKDYGTFDEVA